ncbi:hypothetical protein [Andreprevotia chitinilytica]|uniref:hypothetical protein n=1 Tax=Andreprevotia chitinilytica TaxID=396808 RepID=UPI000552CD26|nr:hypothetical protein [Andreprevotia chitinilytica]
MKKCLALLLGLALHFAYAEDAPLPFDDPSSATQAARGHATTHHAASPRPGVTRHGKHAGHRAVARKHHGKWGGKRVATHAKPGKRHAKAVATKPASKGKLIHRAPAKKHVSAKVRKHHRK